MGYEIANKIWTADTFDSYVDGLSHSSWSRNQVKAVCFHHTGFPDLAMRPGGLTVQHQKNLLHYYRNQKRWSDGPHLFTDDDNILGMSGLLDDGVHAVGFNRNTIAIEVLGNYDVEDPKSGRGLACWRMAFYAAADILQWMGLDPSDKTIVFHREDGYTSKTCPGKRISKEWVIEGVKAAWDGNMGGLIVGSKEPDAPDQVQNKIRIPNWDRYKLVEGGWFVPVHDFMVHIGGESSKIVNSMKSQDGRLYYDGDLIENAYYDKNEKTTYALASELLGFE